EVALVEAAEVPQADTVVTSVVGTVGLRPTLAALRAGKRVALANKETLVCAGELVMDLADRCDGELIPVDSEHSAVFQCLQGCADRGEIKRLILTCSGGPFYGMTREQTARVTREDALRHPNWAMGEKITVDSATLMNKGLEVIEAMRLYHLPLDKVHVVIHRQSIIHSMVEFCDGAILAQMGKPDMRLPIRYALTYPLRADTREAPFDFTVCASLTFAEPDREVFPCLALAEAAAAEGGTACAILNAANEEAVRAFLRGAIGFPDIARLVAEARAALPVAHTQSVDEILATDGAARAYVRERLK
ncbi:MAG: 1-deoxy-D-xylulose-5-phosphate reductoisomerase, partial [Oscillibacter sp.]|nr:1-deoxy-D-xylulose-5-phosphate reductoisomerase [Oscillibacter sp.]